MKEKECFFNKNKTASNEVDWIGYYGSEPHTKAYRGIIGLSIANFDVVEEHVYIPRSSFAKGIHISSIVLRISVFVIMFYLLDLYWFWKFILAFLGSITIGIIYHTIFKVYPRNLYLYNLSSVLDFVIIVFFPLISTVFFPGLLDWFSISSAIFLFFINDFTWKLKKFHLYPYPDKLFSMYEVGFRHGLHPQIDNYLGFIIKPLRWLI